MQVLQKIPGLISDYDKEFIELLESYNNRLVWGAMTALDCIASVNPKSIYKNLNKILEAADKRCVIAKDRAVSILVKLAAEKSYSDNIFTLLIDIFKSCETNQLPMYAENAVYVLTEKYKKDFIKVLTSRLGDIEKETKRERVEEVINKIE